MPYKSLPHITTEAILDTNCTGTHTLHHREPGNAEAADGTSPKSPTPSSDVATRDAV